MERAPHEFHKGGEVFARTISEKAGALPLTTREGGCMTRFLAILGAAALTIALPFGSAQAGSMEDGGSYGMISFAGNVTINPTFGYYPSVRAEFGVGPFLFAGSVGGVFAGEEPDQVVGVDGAFKLVSLGIPFDPTGYGAMYVFIMGGVTSEQGTYTLTVDGSQYRIGPKIFFDFDAKSPTPNKTSLYIAVPFMTSKLATGDGYSLESIKYLAVEGGLSIRL